MLSAMRTLALDYLFQQLGEDYPPKELDSWYHKLRRESPGKLFQFLVEDVGKIEKVFIIRKDKSKECAELQPKEMSPEISSYLPFVKPSGNMSAQIGPVIKRSYSKTKGGGPSRKTLNTTMKYFFNLANSGEPWATYFQEIVEILEAEQVRLLDGSIVNWKEKGYESLLECVVQEIGPAEGPSLITVKDMSGRLPGQRHDYLEYLFKEILSGQRYLTKKVKAVNDTICPLCGEMEVTIYPNALKGAGINLLNMDREGVFPGIDLSQAWKGYSLCAPCADLLYVYKYHVLKKTGPKKDRTPFTASIAGETALVLPYLTVDTHARQALLRKIDKFIKHTPDDVEFVEETILDILKNERGLLNLTFLWAEIGQNLENVTGALTDIPPTRLKELSQFNDQTTDWNHPIFPKVKMRDGKFYFGPDLALRALYPLFYRQGGRKAQNMNASKRLFQTKRDIVAAIYHKTQIPYSRFWDEIMETARSYWAQAIEENNTYTLLYEGEGKKGSFLTLAGWIRHVAWWLYYFKRLEVMEMDDNFFEPEMDSLKPYFGPETGISSPEKAYAFLLGVLYGRVLEIQGGKGVNVGANALTWLKRLTLKGKDLPGLYIKVREKLLAYEAEKSQKVRDLINEIGKLGIKLGDPIELDQTQTNYYLLLGQSMTRTILKGEE